MLKTHWAGKVGAGRSKKSIPFRTQKKNWGRKGWSRKSWGRIDYIPYFVEQ